MPPSPITCGKAPADAVLQTAQSFSPKHPHATQFGLSPVPNYNLPVPGDLFPDMPPHSDPSGEMLNGNHDVDTDGFSFPISTLLQPHSSSPHVPLWDPNQLAQAQCQLPPDLVFNTFDGGQDNADGATTPVFPHFMLPVVPTVPSNASASEVWCGPARQMPPKRSRLPLDTVGRKVPRKSAVISTRHAQSSPNTRRRVTKPKLSQTDSSPNRAHPPLAAPGPVESMWMQAPAPSSKEVVSSDASRQTLAHEVPPARKIVLDDDEKIDSPAEVIDAPKETKEEAEASLITAEEQGCAIEQNKCSQPRLTYEVPPELEGLVLALGQDSWAKYLMLAEQYVLEEITQKEFVVGGERMFHVIHSELRRKIENMVVERLVKPVVRHVEAEKEDWMTL